MNIMYVKTKEQIYFIDFVESPNIKQSLQDDELQGEYSILC